MPPISLSPPILFEFCCLTLTHSCEVTYHFLRGHRELSSFDELLCVARASHCSPQRLWVWSKQRRGIGSLFTASSLSSSSEAAGGGTARAGGGTEADQHHRAEDTPTTASASARRPVTQQQPHPNLLAFHHIHMPRPWGREREGGPQRQSRSNLHRSVTSPLSSMTVWATSEGSRQTPAR
jgi:hypothetical protein